MTFAQFLNLFKVESEALYFWQKSSNKSSLALKMNTYT